MTERIRFDVDTMRQHASRVDQLGDDVRLAVEAIRSVNLSGGAFGLMCAFMIPPVAAVSTVVAAAIGAEQDLVYRTAAELRMVAGELETHEASVAELLRSIEGEL